MPNIPVYESKVQPTAKIRSQASAEDFGAGVGRAMQGLGAEVGQLGQTVTRIVEERETYEAKKAVAKAQVEWAQKQQEAQLNAPEGAENFAETQKQSYDDWLTQQSNQFQTRAANEVLQTGLSNLGNNIFMDNLGFEAKAYGAKQRQDVEQIFGAQQNAVRSRPDQMEFFTNETKQLIDSLPGVDATTKSAIQLKQVQDLHDSAMDGTVTSLETNENTTIADVDAEIARLKDDKQPFLKNATPQGYDDALSRLQRLKEAIKEKDDGLAKFAFQRDVMQLSTTGTTSGDASEARAIAIAKTPLERAQLTEMARTAALVGGEVRRAKDTPLQEDAQRLFEMQAGLGKTTDFMPANERYQAAKQAYDKKLAAYNEDPASYTLNNNNVVKAQYDAWRTEEDPGAAAVKFQNYATFQTALQTKMAPGQPVKLVTKEYATAVHNDMAAISTGTAGVVEAAEKLGQIQVQAGRYGSRVLGELYQAKAIDDAQYVAGNVAIKNNPLAQTILRAGAKSSSDWSKLSGMSTDQANKQAVSALDKLRPSLAAQGNLGLMDTYSKVLAQTILYEQASGRSPDVSKLADSMIIGEYNFGSSRDALRIPKAIDDSQVRRATNYIRNNIDTLNIVPPPGYRQGIEDYKRSVKGFGIWTTDEHEEGATLLDDTGQPVLERVSQGLPDVSDVPAGQIAKGNINLAQRPRVRDAEGNISTVRSITITTDQGAVVLPTVVGDKIVSNKEAIEHWRKTGENLGTFKTEAQAENYAQKLHEAQERYYLGPVVPVKRTWQQLQLMQVK